MARATLDARQAQLDKDGAAEQLRVKFWPMLAERSVSVVLTGQRYPKEAGAQQLELTLLIHIHSEMPLIGLHGTCASGKGRFTFVQTADSVLTNSYSTFLAGFFAGSDPPQIPP